MFALLLLGADAGAYTLRTTDEGAVLRWDRFPIEYRYVPTDGDPAGAEEAVAAAFRTWTDAGTAVAFEAGPAPSRDPEVGSDGRHLVWIEEDWPFDDELLATTDSWFDSDGTLVAFDIRVNGEKPWATDGDPTAYDLQATITHEVGHALGVDHSDVEEATMFATTLPCDLFRRELADDDVDALVHLYDGTAADDPRFADVFASCSSVPGPPALGALVALALVRRRRR